MTVRSFFQKLRRLPPQKLWARFKNGFWSTDSVPLLIRPANAPVNPFPSNPCVGELRLATENDLPDCAAFEDAAVYVPIYRDMIRRGGGRQTESLREFFRACFDSTSYTLVLKDNYPSLISCFRAGNRPYSRLTDKNPFFRNTSSEIPTSGKDAEALLKLALPQNTPVNIDKNIPPMMSFILTNSVFGQHPTPPRIGNAPLSALPSFRILPPQPLMSGRERGGASFRTLGRSTKRRSRCESLLSDIPRLLELRLRSPDLRPPELFDIHGPRVTRSSITPTEKSTNSTLSSAGIGRCPARITLSSCRTSHSTPIKSGCFSSFPVDTSIRLPAFILWSSYGPTPPGGTPFSWAATRSRAPGWFAMTRPIS